ncbi:sulfatase [Halorubrum ezzemoulense]|uniref:sulfatase n=1 Tax=Halorubrum ezzemoulense TaxID=337243 RepID=UPI00232AC9C8|nr:sulfatase [Halorubrum ezzemoulense]MDB2270853.1 sulfatase [Halorubrum ezzemoulense]
MNNNILLIVLDALRADHTSVHGYHRDTTPCLQALAEDGISVDRAFAAAPWTPPSHASMFSGVYPSSHGYLNSNMSFEPPHPPLAELMREEGYSTFGAVRNGHIDSQQSVTRGFEEFGDIYRLPRLPRSLSDLKSDYLDIWPGYLKVAYRSLRAERRPSEYVTCEYLKHHIRHGEKPFLGFININSPHTPYAPPEPFRSQFESFDRDKIDMDTVRALADIKGDGGSRFMAGELDASIHVWNAVKDWYDGEVRFADSLVEDLIKTLQRANLYEETTIIVVGDHGEHFGEHSRAGHQFSLFDELLHVPLVIKPAESWQALEDPNGLVSLVDLYPTILEGLDLNIPTTVQGESLFQPHNTETIFAEYGEPKSQLSNLESSLHGRIDPKIKAQLDTALQCARTSQFKYIKAQNAEDRVFEITKKDPKETEVSIADHTDLGLKIECELGNDLKVEENQDLDEATKANLRELGYI